MSRYTYFYHYPLDVELMNEAAGYLVGEHDFKSFCSANSQAETTVRTIYSIEVLEEPIMHTNVTGLDTGREIIIRITGNGFLYNMVRIIVGTLIEVGNKRKEPYSVKEALEALDRQQAGPTAPPQGLTLVRIRQKQ